jgi:hypothetical protein
MTMLHRLTAAIARLGASGTIDADRPHFHQGPTGRPAACFDVHCAAPHLDI